jgi:hypothetical protein
MDLQPTSSWRKTQARNGASQLITAIAVMTLNSLQLNKI